MSRVGAMIVVAGLVQGVGYRSFVLRHGRTLDLNGYVRNVPDGTVELEVEGERENVERLVGLLREGPIAARVEDVRIEWREWRGEFSGFQVGF